MGGNQQFDVKNPTHATIYQVGIKVYHFLAENTFCTTGGSLTPLEAPRNPSLY